MQECRSVGTLSPTVRSDPAALRRLFCKSVCRASRPQGDFWGAAVRIYGNTAVNTGYYTFSFVKDGEAKTLPARYSFTFVKKGGTWLVRGSSLIGHAPPLK